MAIQDFTALQILTASQMDTLQANDYNWTVSTKTDSYTLTAADKGTRVVMNAATAKTITVDTSIFEAGDTLQIINIGAGTCTVTAGTATVTTSGSLALAQWGGGTLYFTSASASIFFPYGGVSYGTATGGSSSSITVSGINYTLLSFTTDDNLVVSKAGLFDCLTIGGGGAGSSGTADGGGGAGGVQETTIYLAAATYAVDVGAGGAIGKDGFASIIGNSLAVGTEGGRGGAYPVAGGIFAGGNGGSGGGDSNGNAGIGIGITGQGFNGGDNSASGGGGGGGAAAVGGNAVTTTGGNGGAGRDISLWLGQAATTTYKAGGGGGGGTGSGGTGGIGGGGASGVAGTANSGGGGGKNAAGGSGIVYVRFKI